MPTTKKEIKAGAKPDLTGSAVMRIPGMEMAKQVTQVMLVVMLLMSTYQLVKYQIDPQISLITSNIITVFFSTAIAGWASFIIIKRQHRLTRKLDLEVKRRKSVEEKLLRSKGLLELQVAERTEKLAEANRFLTREVAEREKREAKLSALNRDLQEMTRALTVLYDICRRRPVPRSEEEIIRDAAATLPAAWDASLGCGVCITYNDQTYLSSGFDPARVVRAIPVPLAEERVCTIEVSMTSEQPHDSPGRLLDQHMDFLSSVADFLSKALERKVSQREKAKLEAVMRQAQKMDALGTLAGGIAHDFNNILGIIMGCAEHAQQQCRMGADNAGELERIMRAAEQARNVVRQILNFSRDEKGDRRPLNLNEVVDRFREMLERTLPKMIKIESRLDADLSLVNADVNQLEQVLLNLATNAADAMPEGGRLVFETQNANQQEGAKLRLLGGKPKPYVLLMVSDTGHGIDSQTREKIFNPFFTTKQLGEGTGLGLSVVYGIVKGHDGQVFCHSELGMGTTFKVYLPAFQGEKLVNAVQDTPPEELMRGSERILLVDDEEDLREITAHALAGMGYQVRTAGSGEEALKVLNANGCGFELVITDLGMPGMGGYKFLRELLFIAPQVQVIVASGAIAGPLVVSLLESGAINFLPKPFRRADLLGAVRRALDQGPAVRLGTEACPELPEDAIACK